VPTNGSSSEDILEEESFIDEVISKCLVIWLWDRRESGKWEVDLVGLAWSSQGVEERRGNRGAKMLVRHLRAVDDASGLTAMGCKDTTAGFDLRRYGRTVTI
jgi:hypothetical protein